MAPEIEASLGVVEIALRRLEESAGRLKVELAVLRGLVEDLEASDAA